MARETKVERKDKRIIVENVRRVLLKEYLMSETRRAGFGGLDIQRTPMGTRVTLLAERPGLVIGRKGGAIKSLTEAVERQFKFDNPQIEVRRSEARPSTHRSWRRSSRTRSSAVGISGGQAIRPCDGSWRPARKAASSSSQAS